MKQAFHIVLWCLVITWAFGASPMRIRDNAGSNLDTEAAGSLAQHPEVAAAIKLLDAWIKREPQFGMRMPMPHPVRAEAKFLGVTGL